MEEKLLYESLVSTVRRYVRALGAPSRLNRVVDQKPWKIYSNVKSFDLHYWVPQKIPQIYTVIAYICIGKVARFAVYIRGNLGAL